LQARNTFETAYEAFLAALLTERGLRVEMQKPIPVTYRGVVIRDAFRAALLVEQRLVIEVENRDGIHLARRKAGPAPCGLR
jgi:GxxExxY protein